MFLSVRSGYEYGNRMCRLGHTDINTYIMIFFYHYIFVGVINIYLYVPLPVSESDSLLFMLKHIQ